MTIESDLGPKLAMIGAAARERIKYDMRSVAELTDDGRVIPGDSGHGQSYRMTLVKEWQQKFEIMEDHVESICTKLRGYLAYDALNLTLIAGRLTSRAGAGPGSSIAFDAGTSSIVGRLNYASANHLQKVDAMLHADLWKGDAAEAFQEKYLNRLGEANALQAGYSWALALIVQMFHEGLDLLGDDLNKIVDACLAVLPAESNWKLDAASNLSYASLAAGAAGLIPFPPLTFPAGAVSFSAGLASTYLAATADPSEPIYPPWPIEGATAIEILESTWDAIIEVEARMVQIDARISQVINGYLDDPAAFANTKMEVENPSVTSWPRSKIESGAPGPINENPLVISVRDLYQAGYTLLPGFAQEYESAVGICGTARLDSNLSDLYPRAVGDYETARGRLERILADTSATAYKVGAALVTMMSEYELSDAENAELIRQTGELTAPVPRTAPDQDPRPVRGAY
ncbi:hypothetical protein [Actinoplanes xinjiangensis]|uniref:hypothetical protein n=1 Tax=Actinoplanes xinjiangensis TaxID=512350 RepID=UPI0034328BAA